VLWLSECDVMLEEAAPDVEVAELWLWEDVVVL
jgi:hypothetical protein